MSDSQELSGDRLYWVGIAVTIASLGSAVILASRGFGALALAVGLPAGAFIGIATAVSVLVLGGLVRDHVVAPAIEVIRA